MTDSSPVRLIDLAGNTQSITTAGALRVDGSSVVQSVSSGGTSTVAIAAGTTSATVVKASAGRLCKILVTSLAGAVAVSVYDNASAASGTIIGYVTASAAAGTLLDFQLPAGNGITIGGAATNPAMTVSYM